MLNRKSLVATIWLASSLALLASIPGTPIQTPGFITVSAQPNCLLRNFAQPPGQSATSLTASTATDTVLSMKALPREEEEQDRVDALDEPRVSFLIPYSFRKVLDRQSIAPCPILSLYPLRC